MSLQKQLRASKIMAQDSIKLCSKCRDPLSFKPRVNIDLNLDGLLKSSSLEMRAITLLCDEDLDDYDTQIIHLQNEILHLQAQKKRLSDYKTLVQSFLSLFRKLPNEILRLIFESTCTENLLQEYPWPPSSDKLPPITHLSLPAITYLPALAISAVCTRWRSLALASPRLWSQLRLETGCNGKALDDGFLSTLRLYLNRSVDAPLLIDVVTQSKNLSVFNLLLDHANRWRTFSYTGDDRLDELIGFDRSFPILENLALKGDQAGITYWDFKSFENAPKLLTIATGGRIIDLSRSWNHLTSLQTLRPPDEEDIDSLHGYPDLTNLKLSSPWGGFGTGITSLAKLESFTLVESLHKQRDNLLLDMFSSISLPSLTELIIDSNNVQPRLIWPSDAFSAFISRSTCILTTLSLRLVWISDRSLIAAFRVLPALVNFSIDDFLDPQRESPLTIHLISCMSASSPTPILPKLHSLTITTYNASFDDAAFVDMVSSRWLPGSSAAAIGIDCLRSVVLRLPTREVDEAIYRPLENLDSMGMQVVVIGKGKHAATGTNVGLP